MKTKKRYYWRELTDDGLVKDIDPIGPHYDLEYINTYSGYYESEEDAVEGLLAFKKKFEYSLSGYNLILITEYRIIGED